MLSLLTLADPDQDGLSLLDAARDRDLQPPVSARDLFGTRAEEPPGKSVKPWTNWIGDHGVLGFRVRPRSRGQVVGAVQEAVRRGAKIRAVGSGHSHSSAARPAVGAENVWVDMSEYAGELPHRWLRASTQPEKMVRLKAGTTIKKLNRELLPAKGLALPNMGSFDGQTLAGAISTGTHGTGIFLSTLADLVRSIELVTVVRSSTGGKRIQAFRIEPADGITDPEAFGRDFARHGMILEQDDDLFRSVVVSYGCMGIATAYTLEVRDTFWLKETTELIELPELMSLLIRVEGAGDVPDFLVDDPHVTAVVNVAELNLTSSVACLVKRHSEVPPEVEPFGWHRRWPPERRKKPFQDIGQLLQHPAPDDERPNVGKKLRNHYFEPEANKAPFVTGRHESASYIALRRLREGRASVDEPPKPPPRALSSDFAVPAARTGATLRRVLDLISGSTSRFVPPAGVRFTAPSEHYLAASHGRHTGMVEVPILVQAPQNQEIERRIGLAKEALGAVEQALIGDADLGVRPHLGKYTQMDRRDLERSFPKLDRWLESYRRFNPFGIFDNDFTEQFELGA